MTTATNGSGTRTDSRNTVPTSQRPMPVAPRVAPPKGRRRPGLLALGVALIAVGALAAVWLVNSTSQRQPVLVLVRDVPYGAVITSQDIGTAEVSVDSSVQMVAAAQVSSVVGEVAATNLARGSLLTRGQITTAAPPVAGQVLVPVAVPSTRMPSGGLQAGDHVLIVDTPGQDAAPADAPPDTYAATVVRVGPPDVNGTSVVDVSVSTSDGPALAAQVATGRIALVVEPRAGG